MARRSVLANLSVQDLERELLGRKRRVRSLARKHEKLTAKARAIQTEIERLGGSVNGVGGHTGRKRPSNELSLVDALAKMLHGKTMSVTDVAEAVQKAGYQTTSPNFRTIVNQALIASGKFKRVERGQYTTK